jgi:aryl-alcohol dehydrogenase-like predicted oxidoreductase
MNRITIPNTDLKVHPLGLGTVAAGLNWDGKESARMLDTYLDLGGNFIDTAHVYSDWVKPEVARSERVIGDWLAASGKRGQIVLMTKGGHPDMTAEKPDMHRSRMTRADMESDLDSSLQKLQTDYIDLYLYHRDDETQPVEALIEVMQGFVRAGKIRHYGCSNWSTERMRAADAFCAAKGYRGFAVNQAKLNLATRHMKNIGDDTLKMADDAMQQYHRETPSNLLVPYTGLASGYFHHTPEQAARSGYDSEENRALVLRVKEITQKYNVSESQVLLSWLLSRDFPCAPLFGPKPPEQLLDVMKTADIPPEVRAQFIAELDG